MADNNNNNQNLFDHILAELNSENSTLETDDHDQMDQIDHGFDDHDQIDQIAHGFDDHDQMTVAWTTSACSAARTERGGSARK